MKQIKNPKTSYKMEGSEYYLLKLELCLSNELLKCVTKIHNIYKKDVKKTILRSRTIDWGKKTKSMKHLIFMLSFKRGILRCHSESPTWKLL